MAFKVLGIKLSDLTDLIRLHVDLKRDRLGLLSYRINGNYHLGFYFSPIVKNVTAVFTFVEYDTSPPSMLSYSLYDNDLVLEKYISSTRYVNIPIARVKKPPHKIVDPEEIEVSYDIIPVEDIKSLLTIAFSSSIEGIMTPFLWYDESRKSYVLNVEASSDDEEAIAIFTYENQDYKGKYIEADYKNDRFEFVSNIRDISLKYILIIRSNELPFFKFKNKV